MSEMIGRLRVALGLETAAFEKGAKRASAEIDTFGSKAEKAGFKIGSLAKTIVAGGAAIAGSAAVNQLKNMVEESLRYTKALDQMAKVSNASIEEFQGIAIAAQSVGIENDKLADILKDVNDKIGEFIATGGGEMKDFFENIAPKVGVTAEQFKNLSGPQALQLYISSLEKAGLTQQQMTFYMEALANDSTKLIPLMKNNGEAVRAYAEEARKAGIIISQDLADKSVKAGQKVEALKTKLEMRWNVAVAENADKIEAIVNKIDLMVTRFMKLIEQMQKFGNTPIGRLLAKGGDLASYATNPLKGGAELLDAALSAAERKGGAAPVAARPAAGNWSKTTTAPLLQSGSAYTGLRTNFASGSTLLPSASSTLAGMQPGEGKSWADIVWEQNDRWAAVRGELADDTRETAEVINESSLDIAAANERVTESFEAMAQNSLSALQSLVNAVQSNDIVGILQSVLGLGQQLGISFGGGSGFGSAASINSDALSSLRGSSLASLPAYAGGTSFHPGGLAMVGERGPEIVRLPRGSAVYPNGTGPGGGGNTYYLQGNLLTPEFWQRITSQDMQAAQAGGELGYRKVLTKSRRRLA